MEPEDLLGAANDEPEAGAEELRAIVARAQRRRWRVGVGGLTAALLIGGGVGYAVSNHHTSAQSVTTAAASGAKASPSARSAEASGPLISGGQSGSSSSGSVFAPAMFPERLQPLFTRTAGSVDIRGFLLTSTVKMPQGYATPSCEIYGPRFEAEVSTPKMVGTAVSGFASPDPTKALSDVNATILGVAEGDPTLVVTAYAGKGVAEVRETGFTGGATDTMVPVGGWVALAGPTAASQASIASPLKVGTITALNASGQVLYSQTVTAPTPLAGAPLPLSPAVAQVPNGAYAVCRGGTSGTGTGTGTSGTGTGTSGTGTGSSGTGTGTGTSGTGTGTGTLPVPCPPASVPPVAAPGSASGVAGGVSSNVGSSGSSFTCAVHIQPPVSSNSGKAAG
jgi:hypothetical protein